MLEKASASVPPGEETVAIKSPPLAPQSTPVSPDLHSLHRDMVWQPLPPNLLIRKIRTRAQSIHGKIEEHVFSDNGIQRRVVVKKVANQVIERMRGLPSNDFTMRGISEDVLAEMGTYCRIARLSEKCPYLLESHGIYRSQEFTHLILEAADADLFDAVQARSCSIDIRDIMWQLLVAVDFLHRDVKVGHNDISLENLLLKDGSLKLMDFGQATELIATTAGDQEITAELKRPRGKCYYMAPEMYKGRYQAAPADIFACAVVFFILASGGSPPWKIAKPCDASYNYIMKNGVEAMLVAWKKQAISHDAMDAFEDFARVRLDPRIAKLFRTYHSWTIPREAAELLKRMLSPDPADRPNAQECLASPWFEPLRTPSAATEAADDGSPQSAPGHRTLYA